MRPYEGLLTAMVTPFHGDGTINEEAAVALGRHLLANGSNGLVVGGTTGESATLTDDELATLVALMIGELGDEGTIVAGAGSNSTHHAVELTERVVGAGAEAVLSVTPYYNKPNRRGLRRHFEEVARASGSSNRRRISGPTMCEATQMPPAPPWSRFAARMSSLPARIARPSIGCSSSELACYSASTPSICASSASRSGPMLTTQRPGML